MRPLIAMLSLFATGCSLRTFVTPAATIGGATLGAVAGGPGGAALGAGVAYAGSELWTLEDENKQLVTAITTGDVKGIVAASMQSQKTAFNQVTGTIWTTLKISAFVVLAFLLVPVFWSRANHKKLKEVLEK
jgi:hypothetical protein|tara:strand:- start:80 stop:475 length:396 start_codon:yes stop_codon:yes gene_type:complete